MTFNKEILFFLSTLGWFNGLILSSYFLFFIPKKTLPNTLFGLLLLVLSIRISKSVVWYFYPDLPVFFIQLGLAVCFLIGPLLFFYLKAVSEQTKTFPGEWGIILGSFVMASVLLMLFFTDKSQLYLWKKYFVKIIYGEWFLTVLISGIFIIPLLKKLRTGYVTLHEKWVLAVYFSNLMIASNFVVSYLDILNVAYITGGLTFSLLIYLNILILFYRKKTGYLFSPEPEKYSNKKISPDEAGTLILKLETALTEKEIYKNPDLKLPEMAGLLHVSVHQLSQLLNDNLQKTFPVYLNEFRVKKACEIIDAALDFKIEAIGYEVGYHSKSTFFAAFKKITGLTPSQYKAAKVS